MRFEEAIKRLSDDAYIASRYRKELEALSTQVQQECVGEVIGFELGLPSLDWASLVNPLTIGTKLYTHPPAAQVQQADLTDTYVQTVPDKCDRITWRGRYYRLPITHPAGDALGAVRELPAQWRHNAQGCGRRDQHAAGTWRSCARELEAALQHRGDSRGGEGS